VTFGAEEIISLYERHAAAWLRLRDSNQFIEARWMKRFQELLSPGCAILDIGCGSGRPISQFFIERGFEVVGVDSSETLIDSCRDGFPYQQWIVADMRTLSLGRRFQGLIAWDSFFHLSHDHQRKMFEVFREHAADGAALIFNTGTVHGEAIGSFEGERLYHASLSTDEYQNLFLAHGFRVIRHEADDPQCGGRAVWLAQSAGHGLESNAGAT
jgi:SAM-dependent methyltransferase